MTTTACGLPAGCHSRVKILMPSTPLKLPSVMLASPHPKTAGGRVVLPHLRRGLSQGVLGAAGLDLLARDLFDTHGGLLTGERGCISRARITHHAAVLSAYKSRGVWQSCNACRAHDTAIHLLERVRLLSSRGRPAWPVWNFRLKLAREALDQPVAFIRRHTSRSCP